MNRSFPATVIIYTDGACRGNPGPGGWAAVILENGRIRQLSGGEPSTTNNRMELTAVIKALESLRHPVRVEVHSDSQYLVRGITEWLPKWLENQWKTSGRTSVRNADLWRRLYDLTRRHTVRWYWLRGHRGNPLNALADRLANEAIPKLSNK